MKDLDKATIETLLQAEKKASEEREKKFELERKKTTEFNEKVHRVMNEIVIPTLKECREYLTSLGKKCEISESNYSLIFENRAGEISFIPRVHNKKIAVYVDISRMFGGHGTSEELEVDAITKEFVESKVVKMIEECISRSTELLKK